jgi:hypothetical protein
VDHLLNQGRRPPQNGPTILTYGSDPMRRPAPNAAGGAPRFPCPRAGGFVVANLRLGVSAKAEVDAATSSWRLDKVAVQIGRAETIGRPWLWRLKVDEQAAPHVAER